MPKVTPAYRAERRAHILAAARRCFLRKGFQESSMPDLLAEAQLSSGAVYNYFSSKDEMILAIAEENIAEVTAMIREVVSSADPRSVGATIVEILARIRGMHADNGFAGMTVQVWAEALNNGDLADQFRTLAQELRLQYGKLATNAPRSMGVTAEALAETMAAIVSGFILQLALFGPHAAEGLPPTVEALWPPLGDGADEA